MHERPDNAMRVRLELVSVADAVTLVRSVVRTVARAADLDEALVDDLRTAVSEACNNVVLHAYPTEPGPLIVSLAIHADSVEALVRDRGCGITLGSVRNRGLGMGVALINKIADRAAFESARGTGTEVRMVFRRPVPSPRRSTDSALRSGRGRIRDRQSLFEPSQAEQAMGLRPRILHAELEPAFGRPLLRAHKHAQPRRVDELDAAQVDDHRRRGLG